MTYTGPNIKVGDYYVRFLRYSPKERNVHFEVVGTGRCEFMTRRRFLRLLVPT